MDTDLVKDNGGRRRFADRRYHAPLGPVLEKRKGKERRKGFDRRKVQDPFIRMVDDERRKVFRDFFDLIFY